MQITGLDTTPVMAVWSRRPAMDRQGFTAFAVQEDALDRLYVGLVKLSADGSVRSVVASDGGQFNLVYHGAHYERTGTVGFPTATGSGPSTGQVSYAGEYLGLANGGGDGAGLLPVPVGTPASNRPGEPARVTGNVFMNANFAENRINGSITDRVEHGPVQASLEDVILVPTDIIRAAGTTEGSFVGKVERPVAAAGTRTEIGDFGGILGGSQAQYLAGAIKLTAVYDDNGDLVRGATEVGGFVLTQCGVAGAPATGCAGTAP